MINYANKLVSHIHLALLKIKSYSRKFTACSYHCSSPCGFISSSPADSNKLMALTAPSLFPLSLNVLAVSNALICRVFPGSNRQYAATVVSCPVGVHDIGAKQRVNM